MEAAYIVFYLAYAPLKVRLRTLAYFFLLDVAAFALVIVVTLFVVREDHRVKFLSSVCLAFSMAVFVTSLSIIIKVVINTVDRLLGRPEGFRISVRQVTVSAAAGFVVAIAGSIMKMPGLPKVPAAEKIDISEDGKIVGLF